MLSSPTVADFVSTKKLLKSVVSGDSFDSTVCCLPYTVDELGEVTTADGVAVHGDGAWVEIELGRGRPGVDETSGLV